MPFFEVLQASLVVFELFLAKVALDSLIDLLFRIIDDLQLILLILYIILVLNFAIVVILELVRMVSHDMRFQVAFVIKLPATMLALHVPPHMYNDMPIKSALVLKILLAVIALESIWLAIICC